MRTHKSLHCWSWARETTRAVFRLSRAHRGGPAAAVFQQLDRAALSTQLNIAEGFALWTRAQQLRHLRIAYGSAIETAELLELLADEALVPGGACQAALTANHRCRASLVGYIKKLQKKESNESNEGVTRATGGEEGKQDSINRVGDG